MKNVFSFEIGNQHLWFLRSKIYSFHCQVLETGIEILYAELLYRKARQD